MKRCWELHNEAGDRWTPLHDCSPEDFGNSEGKPFKIYKSDVQWIVINWYQVKWVIPFVCLERSCPRFKKELHEEKVA